MISISFGRRRTLKRGVEIRVSYTGRVFVEWPGGPSNGVELNPTAGPRQCEKYTLKIVQVYEKRKFVELEAAKITRVRRTRFKCFRTVNHTMPRQSFSDED